MVGGEGKADLASTIVDIAINLALRRCHAADALLHNEKDRNENDAAAANILHGFLGIFAHRRASFAPRTGT